MKENKQKTLLRSSDDLIAAVEQYGFLPFFRNEIHGFSVEELCPPELWFADDVDGPWEWKGPAARSGKCLYGKLFNKKAGFVSREWIPDFANFRRDGYDFDARWDDGLASYKDKEIYEAIASEGRMLSRRLKEDLNYRKGGNTGFETCITRLQMQSYVCIADFVYMQDKYGRPYGWGVAEYATPEELFGYGFITSAYQRDPQESKERMMQHLSSILPHTSSQQIILRRYPETNGVFDVCKEYGITLIPYAPLAEGTLTGKYRGKKVPLKYSVTSYFGHLDLTKERDDNIPFIKRLFSKPRECDIKKMEPLMCEMEQIAKAHGKTIAQVAINWLVTNPDVNVFPIPGMRKQSQAEDNFGAVEWALSPEEREIINHAEIKCR